MLVPGGPAEYCFVFSELGDQLCFRLAIGTRHLFFTTFQLANRSRRVSLAAVRASNELSCAVQPARLSLVPYSRTQQRVLHSMPIEISPALAYTA